MIEAGTSNGNTDDMGNRNELSPAQREFNQVASVVFHVEITPPEERTPEQYGLVEQAKGVLVNMDPNGMDERLREYVRKEIAKCNALLNQQN